MTKNDFLMLQIKKSIDLLENGKKIQLEIDRKNDILRVCEISTKKIQFPQVKFEEAKK